MAKKKTHGGRRSGAGRKPGPAATLRRNLLSAKLTDAEMAAIDAALGGKCRSVWIRDLALAAIKYHR